MSDLRIRCNFLIPSSFLLFKKTTKLSFENLALGFIWGILKLPFCFTSHLGGFQLINLTFHLVLSCGIFRTHALFGWDDVSAVMIFVAGSFAIQD